MQAVKRRHLKWHTAETLEGKNQHVDALVLISVEMSRGTTADEMWQAWVTHDKVSWWREGDVNVLDSEASGALHKGSACGKSMQAFLGMMVPSLLLLRSFKDVTNYTGIWRIKKKKKKRKQTWVPSQKCSKEHLGQDLW